MREVMLSAHFIGLSMTFGTSLAFLFLRIASSRMEDGDALRFKRNILVLNKMSYMGLLVMVLSGGYLMTPYWKVLGEMPWLMAKLLLVVLLIIQVILILVFSKKVKGETGQAYLKKIDTLDKVSFLTTVFIVILAVSVFH